MPADDKRRDMHQALVDRVTSGNGQTSQRQRALAFRNADLPHDLLGLIDKVATRSWKVTDGDVAAVQRAGFSDSQIFELVVCGAVGEANRQYQSGLAALDAALIDQELP
jgi:alkylhydroperoxidase family enzyme